MSNRKFSWNSALASAKADRTGTVGAGKSIAAQRMADLQALKDKRLALQQKGIWFDPHMYRHMKPNDLAVMNAAAAHFHSDEIAAKIPRFFKPGMTLKEVIDHFEKHKD